MQRLTTIYSQPSIEECKNLVNCFLNTFRINNVDFDEMFYYGVFCDTSTYANYDWITVSENINGMYIPPQLLSIYSDSDERINYVETIINQVLRGEIEKPEWMTFVEMESDYGCQKVQPSNFLRLIPKHECYIYLANALISFLYSSNRINTCFNDKI